MPIQLRRVRLVANPTLAIYVKMTESVNSNTGKAARKMTENDLMIEKSDFDRKICDRNRRRDDYKGEL